MSISNFDYFILRCVALGMKQREIACVLGYSTSAVGQRLIVIRKQYHVQTTRELLRVLLGE